MKPEIIFDTFAYKENIFPFLSWSVQASYQKNGIIFLWSIYILHSRQRSFSSSSAQLHMEWWSTLRMRKIRVEEIITSQQLLVLLEMLWQCLLSKLSLFWVEFTVLAPGYLWMCIFLILHVWRTCFCEILGRDKTQNHIIKYIPNIIATNFS